MGHSKKMNTGISFLLKRLFFSLKFSIKNQLAHISPNWFKKRLFKDIEITNINSLKENRTREPELFLIKDLIKKDDICFDIGSYHGEYIYQIEKYTNPKNIYAFEPIKFQYKVLKKLFKKSNIFNLALSDSKKNVKIKAPILKNGQISFTRSKLNKEIVEDDEVNFLSFNISCDTLDNFCINNKIDRINFIKIDVEGSEFDILKGGYNTLKTFKPIMIIEIEDRHHQNDKINEIFNFINSIGYEIKFFDLISLEYKSIDLFSVSKNQKIEDIKTAKYINNFICFPINV